MPLNPLAFDSQDSFEKALAEEGLKRGWTALLPRVSTIIHDILDVNGTLSHHGVKGMKWGVRRKATVGAQEVIVSDKRKKIKTSGGAGHPAHPDAIKVRTSAQVAKKSGLKSLSNAELKAYNERLNLEQNFKRLNYQDKSAGRRFVQTLLLKKGPGVAQSGAQSLKDPAVRAKIASGVAALALAASGKEG